LPQVGVTEAGMAAGAPGVTGFWRDRLLRPGRLGERGVGYRWPDSDAGERVLGWLATAAGAAGVPGWTIAYDSMPED
jgi:hypothetical protein